MKMSSSEGDDSLVAWLRRIKERDEDEDAKKQLLESFTKLFQGDKYKTDIRYLKLWILYADSCGEFEQIYSIMEAKGIGIYHSLFYEAYATYLEIQRKLCEANAVYLLGLSRKAQPLAKLKSMYTNFINRMLEIADPSVKTINSGGKVSGKRSFNPWSGRLITKLLEKLNKQILKYKGYNVSTKKYSGKTCLSSLRNAARNKLLDLGSIKYHIKGCSGEGAFAQVFKAHVDGRSDDIVALKIQRPACPWEFYMYRQLDVRISSEERSSFGSAWKVHVYSDCSILVCDYVEHGTLQDVINSYLVTGQCMDEVLCIYYTIELLRMLEALHYAGLIHGDVKPDNLLIRYASEEISEEWNPSRMGGWKDQGLCLIDWGRGIDTSLFPCGTEFEADSKTSSFRCIEMQEKRPWTFQVDTYGVCVIAHMMLHGSYMELVKQASPDGDCFYRPKATVKR
ncbi:hypothetical protein KI387_010828, partial [Taxus chinensis]